MSVRFEGGGRYRWLIVLLLAPSLYYLAANTDVPKFCDLHDDCIYFVSAKSLTDGGGYRIASLPGEPPQTKYPPLYPALLSLAWRINPSFPANLTPAVWLSWLALPAILWLLSSLYPRLGITGWRLWTAMALLAINPYTLTFSSQLLSEPLFVALLVASLLLVERASAANRGREALAAGIVMGLAYLTRSAGIVALGTVPVFFFLRRQPRQAMTFAGGIFPFVAGWMLWARLHQIHVTDPALMYYVDYAGYQAYNVSMNELPVLLWKNIDGILWALGSLVIPRVSDSLFLKILSEVIGIAMIAGVVRMLRQGNAWNYALFALGSCGLLAIWHFPPNERFVYPIFPLAIAGLVVELEHLGAMLKAGQKHPDRSQRVAGKLIASVAGLVLFFALALQVYMGQVFLPEGAQQARAKRASQQAAFDWVKREVPESGSVVAMRDPLFYLATGRHAMSRPVLPIHWYHDDQKAIVDTFQQMSKFARERDFGYVYYAGVDFGWSMADEDNTKIEAAFRTDTGMHQTFQQAGATVYRVTDQLAGANRLPQESVNHTADQHDDQAR